MVSTNVLLTDSAGDPNDNDRVYTITYIVHTVRPIPIIRLFEKIVLGMDKIVQVTFVSSYGLTLGATHNLEANMNRYIVPQLYTLDDDKSSIPLSPLGITLKWVRTHLFTSYSAQCTDNYGY